MKPNSDTIKCNEVETITPEYQIYLARNIVKYGNRDMGENVIVKYGNRDMGENVTNRFSVQTGNN